MKLTWLIDEYIFESRSVVGDLSAAIVSAGHEVYKTKYIPLSDDQDYGNFSSTDPVLLYGTIGYVKRCKIPFIPGSYGINENTNCNFYYSNLPKDWMLNSENVFTTFGILKNDTLRFFDMFGDSIFIRPNSGRKTFTGHVITRKNYADELSSSMQITSVTDETIILVSKAIDLQGEFRFVIGNKEVIDGSEYRWDNILDIRHDYPIDCWKLSDKMAKWKWQPDICYTVDVALTDAGPKIIELNGFSCAGLYACDKELIAGRISEIAIADFKGDL